MFSIFKNHRLIHTIGSLPIPHLCPLPNPYHIIKYLEHSHSEPGPVLDDGNKKQMIYGCYPQMLAA